jgi:hypothetical protein
MEMNKGVLSTKEHTLSIYDIDINSPQRMTLPNHIIFEVIELL